MKKFIVLFLFVLLAASAKQLRALCATPTVRVIV